MGQSSQQVSHKTKNVPFSAMDARKVFYGCTSQRNTILVVCEVPCAKAINAISSEGFLVHISSVQLAAETVLAPIKASADYRFAAIDGGIQHHLINYKSNSSTQFCW